VNNLNHRSLAASLAVVAVVAASTLVWPSPALADGIVGVPGQTVQGIVLGTPDWWLAPSSSDYDSYRTLRFGITLSNVTDSIKGVTVSFTGYLPDGNVVACPWPPNSHASILPHETAYVGCEAAPRVPVATTLDQVTFRVVGIGTFTTDVPRYEVTQAPNLTQGSAGEYYADTRFRALQSDVRLATVLFRFYDANGVQVAECPSEAVWDLEPEASRRVACVLGVGSPEPDPQITEVRVTPEVF
jgi:hypothetical protein